MSETSPAPSETASRPAPALRVRASRAADMPEVEAIDARITGLAKPDYWAQAFARYGEREDRWFLVAEAEGGINGFIIGEQRAWEFGSPPCGWVFAIGVDPALRLSGIGTRLFEAITGRMREAGVALVRTMLARDDALNMAFFRSQGMMGGSFIQLEMPLDDGASKGEKEAP